MEDSDFPNAWLEHLYRGCGRTLLASCGSLFICAQPARGVESNGTESMPSAPSSSQEAPYSTAFVPGHAFELSLGGGAFFRPMEDWEGDATTTAGGVIQETGVVPAYALGLGYYVCAPKQDPSRIGRLRLGPAKILDPCAWALRLGLATIRATRTASDAPPSFWDPQYRFEKSAARYTYLEVGPEFPLLQRLWIKMPVTLGSMSSELAFGAILGLRLFPSTQISVDLDLHGVFAQQVHVPCDRFYITDTQYYFVCEDPKRELVATGMAALSVTYRR